MDVVGSVAYLPAVLARGIDMGYHQQVVLAVMLDHTTSLQQSALILLPLEDVLVSTLDDIRQVGFQFHQLSGAIDDIYPVIVIEE